jgi:hypothetical protein
MWSARRSGSNRCGRPSGTPSHRRSTHCPGGSASGSRGGNGGNTRDREHGCPVGEGGLKPWSHSSAFAKIVITTDPRYRDALILSQPHLRRRGYIEQPGVAQRTPGHRAQECFCTLKGFDSQIVFNRYGTPSGYKHN